MSKPDQPTIALGEAKKIVADLFKPNPLIYWTDFLVSLGVGGVCFFLVSRIQPRWLAPVCFLLCCAGYYRAVLFTHELTHLRAGTFRAFRVAWNVLCGVPFLLPSYTYHTHLAHHRSEDYGTSRDGEYLPLGTGSPWKIITYLLLAFVIPIGAIFRFVVLTPIAWVVPGVRRWVDRHLSSMVMDYSLVRPDPTPDERWSWRLQEAGCWLVWTTISVLLIQGILPPRFLVQAYATGAFIILLNQIRTAAAHHFASNGEPMTFTEQILDSVNIPGTSLLTTLWAPVGLRYHALHHMFPSMPYHSLHPAHRRLMEQLPESSPYRATVRSSLLGTFCELWRDARKSQKEVRPAASAETPASTGV